MNVHGVGGVCESFLCWVVSGEGGDAGWEAVCLFEMGLPRGRTREH